jgi:acyl-CoA thioesterase-1
MSERIVLVFGDSFAAGVGDPDGLGWTGRVTAASWAAGLRPTTYALGVRGQTSEEVVARWPLEARPRLLGGDAGRVAFCFGANDATPIMGTTRVRPASSVACLADALAEAAAWRLPAFVVGPPPAGDAAQHGRILALEVAFADVCREHGAPFVPTCEALLADGAWMHEARAGDGAHPGARGYAALARLVLRGGWLDWLRG